ncbi:MAG: hypothetical protein J0L82_19245 [Deltaproteobacteria bacterium]|jgi:hypothetical protein|nr:hypothetical protein [Deltaproteobacteria bacterium]
MEQKPRIGKPGGAKRVAEAFKKLREQTISQEVRDMLEESAKREKEEQRKRSAGPPKDAEV